MKNQLLTALIITVFSNFSFAQRNLLPVDSTTNQVTYTEVINTSNSKKIIFANLKTWLSKTYSEYQWNSLDEDTESGRISLNGTTKITGVSTEILKLNIIVNYKDQKYRYIISEIQFGWKSASNPSKVDYFSAETLVNSYKKGIKESVSLLVKSVETKDKAEEQRLENQRKEIDKKTSMAAEEASAIDAKIKSLIVTLKATLNLNNDF